MLSTKRKIAIARMLNLAIVGTRAVAGRPSRVTVRRRNVNWDLDLDEGIDFAIYLGVYQRIPPRIVRWITPGALVLDIGANIGAHSLPLAHTVGRNGCVVAIEPTDYAFSRLQANAALNSSLLSRLVLVQAALTAGADGPGGGAHARFYSRWPLKGSGDRHAKHLGKLEAAMGARFMSLDALLQEVRAKHGTGRPVSFIKLDVDGHELDVLRGAVRLLAAEKPPILIEIGPHVQDEVPQRFDELLQTLQAHGYWLEASDTGKRLPMSARELRALIGDDSTLDVVARAHAPAALM